MATPTNLPAAFTVGQVATAAQINDLRGAFRVLQVVFTSFATVQTNTTATYVDTGLSATITPQSASNKILVITAQNGYTGLSGISCGIRLLRGATVIQTQTDAVYGVSSQVIGTVPQIVLDNPATTSAVTYKTQFARNTGASGSVFAQPNNNPSTIILCEISA